jgi:hypothetical protein
MHHFGWKSQGLGGRGCNYSTVACTREVNPGLGVRGALISVGRGLKTEFPSITLDGGCRQLRRHNTGL